MAKRRTTKSKRGRALLVLLAVGICGGMLAWFLWPAKAKAGDGGESDGSGGGPGPEGQIVKNDAWTLRNYPHSEEGTHLKIADNAQTRAFNNSARVRADFRTTDGSWVLPIGHLIGHATGDSVKWQNIRFIKMRSHVEGSNIDTWVAANLVTQV